VRNKGILAFPERGSQRRLCGEPEEEGGVARTKKLEVFLPGGEGSVLVATSEASCTEVCLHRAATCTLPTRRCVSYAFETTPWRC
jgi:hypothetical protein